MKHPSVSLSTVHIDDPSFERIKAITREFISKKNYVKD